MDKRIVGRSDPFDWDHRHVSNVMTRQVKVVPCWCLKSFVVDITYVVVHPLFNLPLGLPDIDKILTSIPFTYDLIYAVHRVAIHWGCDVPLFPSSIAFVLGHGLPCGCCGAFPSLSDGLCYAYPFYFLSILSPTSV